MVCPNKPIAVVEEVVLNPFITYIFFETEDAGTITTSCSDDWTPLTLTSSTSGTSIDVDAYLETNHPNLMKIYLYHWLNLQNFKWLLEFCFGSV